MARNRMTLLEVVQYTLSAMNHDSVNSISDTIESQQIADQARIVYYELMDRDDWPHLMKLIPLEAVSDVDRPNFLKIPEDVVSICDIRYEITQSGETQRQFDTIDYMTPSEFLDYVHTRNTDNSDVDVINNSEGVPMFILNDERPHYWTTFDDEFIVFDSYDSDVDTTLQSSKSLAYVKEIPTWTNSDTFVPDMPDQMFSVFLAELTATSFTYWKQGISPKDETRAARGISRLRKDARKTNGQSKKTYGRPRAHYYPRSESGSRGSARDASARF